MSAKPRTTEALRSQHAINQAAVRMRRRDQFRNIVREFLDHPCVDCGQRFPLPAMVTDHVRGEKFRNVSWWMNGSGTEDGLRAELAKCDVRCANCHAIRHAAPWRLGQ